LKDTKWIVLCVIAGLALAYFVGAPLRRSASSEPRVGTPLNDNAKVYAEGTITVASNVQAADYPALFVIVRAAGSAGAPLAVRRIVSPTFPLEFKMTERDAMAGGEFYEGDITVLARLDADGAGGPKHPDDLEATASIHSGASREIDLQISR
jgi:hypothetical protein